MSFEPPDDDAHAPRPPAGMPEPRRTMPPPELFDRPAPASVGQLVLEGIRKAAPISRHTGPRAEEASLRSRVAEHRAEGDVEGEREASIALARLMASRGTDLDVATSLARRALSIGEDPALRAELAGWLAGLGEPALAAAALRGLCVEGRPETAPTLIRIAVLLARANDPAGAADALQDAAALDEREAIASELLGTLSAWAPSEVSPADAAAAYLVAAARREAAKDKEAAFEDRLRAFEAAPSDPAAAESLAGALAARGRSGAADEVLRAHARSMGPEPARDVHRRRLLAALKEGDAPRGVGAVLDGALEGDLGGELDAKIDEVLSQAGLYEIVAARLELAAESRTGGARADAYERLARLYGGPLASPDRALEAWIEAAAADPDAVSARGALRDHGSTLHDWAPLCEALVRIGAGEPAAPPARAAALRELAIVAEDKVGDAALASWAVGRLGTAIAAAGKPLAGIDPEELASAGQRLAPRVRAHDEALAAARRASEEGGDALRRLEALERGRPDEAPLHLETLARLARETPSERSFTLALERLTWRTGDTSRLEALMRARVESAGPRVELVRARLTLATIARRAGDEARALEEVLPLLGEAPSHRGAASAALVLASRAGEPRQRAEALVQLAGPVQGALRSVLLAVAAELYAASAAPAGDAAAPAPGERDAQARRCAEQACEADPSSPRAVAALAAIAGGVRDRMGAAAMERAMGIIVPRGDLCDALAQTLEELGEIDLALAWTQRWLALRPGAPRAVTELIRRAVAAKDAARLSDALAWVLAQPEPLGELAAPFADALDVLQSLDAQRAAAIARRALDVFGPRVASLRARLLALADRTHDAALAISVLERWLGAEPSVEQGTMLLLELGRRRAEAGDHDGAAREICRAAERGADPHAVVERVHDLQAAAREGAGLGSDGTVALTEARARALTALGPSEATLAANAWRELGSLRWDLAGDRRGAEEAFFRASQLVPDGGGERYARDLSEFAGVEETLDAIVRRANDEEGTPDRKARANLLIEAANLATAHELPERALSAASKAIELDSSRADAIALVERSAHAPGGLEVLDRMYDLLAAAALGRYGQRAAHYRGARQLERRNATELAFRHAIACFEAVPAEGTSYVLLARLAERSSDPAEAVRALERVADAGDVEVRTTWLKRAAALAGKGHDGAQLRFDILLRALNVRPDPAIAKDVGRSLAELLAATGDRDVPVMRFERAVKAALPRLDGPEGARTAVAMSRVALEAAGAASVAVAALERAMKADGDIDEYATLRDLMPGLATEREAAVALLENIKAAAEKPYSSVGPALLRMASGLAAALGDRRRAADFLVQAARRAPDDDALVEEADAAVRELSDEPLRKALDDALPVARRIEALMHLADKAEREGDVAQAALALERAAAIEELSDEDHDKIVSRLRQVLGASGSATEIEALLRRELARDVSAPTRLRLARDLAGVLTGRGDHAGALDVLADAALRLPDARELLAEVQRLARRTGDRRRQVDVLTRMVDLAADDAAKVAFLRELAPLVHEVGDRAAAMAHYEALSRLDPTDADALGALEADATERGDHEALAGLLERRIQLAVTPESRRRLRLRRAAVLEQRLGRLDEAGVELEALLHEGGDDETALRFLADLLERQGAPLRAAPLWRRAGDLAAAPDEKADYGLRAARAYLAGGEVEPARAIVAAIGAGAPREPLVEIGVEIARRVGDQKALAAALDELASLSLPSAERRVEVLLEAARAHSAAGDDAGALEQALRAVKLAPDSPDAVLEARRLTYKSGGSGTPREAQAAVEELGRIAGDLAPAQIELFAFLLAEELDVYQGGNAGMRELSRRHAEIGPVPLIALGMAERMVRSKSFEAALPLFERALAGSLQGLRSRGKVALAAAEAAAHSGELEIAARLLEEAAVEPDTRAVAQRRQLELIAARGAPSAARQALLELAAQSTGIDRARVLGQLGRLLSGDEPAVAIQHYREALALAAPDKSLSAQLADDLAILEASHAPPPPPAPEPAAEPEPASEAAAAAPPPLPVTPEPPVIDDADVVPDDLPGPVSGKVVIPIRELPPEPMPVSLRPTALGAREDALLAELMQGSYEAGDQLVAVYGARAGDRVHDVLAIRKQQAAIRPGDRATLAHLHEAAVADGNPALARAVEHAMHAFDPGAGPPPPPLSSQRLAPELITALLFRGLGSPASEALAIAWESGLYRRDPSQYGLAGTARVQPGAPTALGDVYGTVGGHLGLLRVPLFHQRVPGALGTQIALLAQPAVVLTGDAREDTPELRFALGAALTGAMPEHALVNAQPADSVRSLIAALRAAFGPVGAAPRGDAAVARLAQDLWQTIPPRQARRLGEICADGDGLTYEAARECAGYAMRRAGLFASGHLGVAVQAAVSGLGLALAVPLHEPDGLARACASHPAIADLVRLATRMEYAEARWQERRRGESGRFSATPV